MDLKLATLALMTTLPVTATLEKVPSIVVEQAGEAVRLIVFVRSDRLDFDDVQNVEFVPGWEIDHIVEAACPIRAMKFLMEDLNGVIAA